ncbi:MAG: metallophosphoesterase, partial [Lachnospiraceae bacterium]|nr:metallophosphoesterase [Lachnospiraceae bacterium]
MIYITGDCHGDFERFSEENFPEQKNMTKEDYVIICGDFGGVWNVDQRAKKDAEALNWLNDRPFTTLFVCGNHENFDRLRRFPLMRWNGGKIHRIRPSIYHMMRGQVYELEGKKFFTFGGAQSHDIQGGILEMDDPLLIEKIKELKKKRIPFRINKVTWWKEEMPSQSEMEEGLQNLALHGNKVDFIVTHCCASSTLAQFGMGFYKPDYLHRYLQRVKEKCTYKKWFFGHYHQNKNVGDREILLWEQI